MALLTISRLITPFLILLGGYSLHVFSESNGLFPQIASYRSKHVLPTPTTSTVESFPTAFTGLDPPDGLLGTLLVFFWPLVDGENPGASLVSFLFVGQAVAAWTATVLEGSRKGNKGRLISFTTIYGLMVQTLGFALVGPAYLTLYLFTSPLVASSAALTPSALSIPEGFLSGHPFGLVVGFLLPTILMCLPSPSVLAVNSKITAVLVWQVFPLWTTVYTYVWKAGLWPTINYASEADELATQLPLLRTVYRFALAISVPAHIATWTLTLSTVLFPGLFTPQALDALHPLHVFVPPNPFDGGVKAASVAQGSHWFIQYDYIIASLAVVVWALASRYASGVVKTAKSDGFGIGSLLDVAGRCVLLGPMAAALTLLWDRDEAVFAEAETAVVKKTT